MKKLNNFLLISLVAVFCASCSEHKLFKPAFKKYGSAVSEEVFEASINSLRTILRTETFYPNSSSPYSYKNYDCLLHNLIKSKSIISHSSTIYEQVKLETNEKCTEYDEIEVNASIDAVHKRFKSTSVYKASFSGYYENNVYFNKTKNSVVEKNVYGELRDSTPYIFNLDSKTYSEQRRIEYYTTACLGSGHVTTYYYYSYSDFATDSSSEYCNYYINNKTFTQVITDGSYKYIMQYTYGKKEIRFTMKQTYEGIQDYYLQTDRISYQIKNTYYFQIIIKDTKSTVKAIDYNKYQPLENGY